ncbi:MAG: ArnT family glycosyltransferase [Cytophagales bacterium]
MESITFAFKKINLLSDAQIKVLVAVFGALLFMPFLGQVHLFDWDEINFAESAREMLLTNDFLRVQINFEPFWEKPPLFFWLQAISMKLFGINEFAARFPNALVGVGTFVALYHIGNQLFNRKFALLWVLAYAGTFLPHLYFKSGIIDPLFNLLIFLAIYQLHQAFSIVKNAKAILWAGLFIGLALLTKGPVALLVSGLVAVLFLVLKWELNWKNIAYLLLFSIAALIVASLWFGLETWQNGSWFLQTFFDYNLRLMKTEDSGHGQPVYYHPIVLFIGCVPTSILCLRMLVRNKDVGENSFALIMQLLFWVVLVIFSLVKTKIVHYSSLCYFPITFLAVFYVFRYRIENWQKVLISIMAVLIGLAFVALPFFVKNVNYFLPFINDVFARENLKADVYWSGFEAVVGFILILSSIYGLWFIKNSFHQLCIVFFGIIISFQLALYWIVPKIETHVQGAMIDFLISTQKEDCYVKAIGFKSYAQYFYTNRKPNYNAAMDDETRLVYGKIDKPAYLITKCDRDSYRLIPQLEVVMEKNGWVVYKRKP